MDTLGYLEIEENPFGFKNEATAWLEKEMTPQANEV
jgi:hypothetical protein